MMDILTFDQIDPGLQNDLAQLQTQQAISADDIRLMSYNQRTMWFLQQMDPETSIYNLGFSFHIRMVVDAEHMKQAWQLIVDRHEVLRTIYPIINGEPVQVVLPRQEVAFEFVDTTAWSETNVEQAIVDYLHQPFDLSVDNVMRVRFYMVGEAHCVLQFVVHHVAADAWSMWLLVDEFLKNLAVLQQGDYPEPKPLRYQYTDFVQWQRDLLASKGGQLMGDYWLVELAGDLPGLDLPTKGRLSSDEQISYAQMQFVIEPELAQKVRDLAFREGASSYSFFLAVFQVLLSKYSNQRDVLVGSPVHGRGSSRFAMLVGYFVNLAVMRGIVDPKDSFRAFLRKTGEKVQAALLNQHYPFALTAKEKQLFSDGSPQEITQVMFNLFKAPKRFNYLADIWLDDTGDVEVEAGPLVIDQLNVEAGNGINGIDLYLEIVEIKKQLFAKFRYNPALFEPEMISHMAAHFNQLLENVVTNPDQPLGQLSMLTKAEREKLLTTWNETAVSWPPNQFIHTLIAEQAARTPEATAVLFKDQALSYRELNERSNQLAHYLRSLGVGPDKRVGIAIERSCEMIIALLGILKSGGAYLPLDPTYPQERLAELLADATPHVLLTEQSLTAQLPLKNAPQKMTFVYLDSDGPLIRQQSKQNPDNIIEQDNLAYVIYTSGSTGKPKGVMIPHRAILNHNLAVANLFQLVPEDRVWQFATINFDGALEEIFPTLIRGATLALRDDHIPAPNQLNQLVEQASISVLNFPTAYWAQWVNELFISKQTLPDCLRLVIVGGEKVERASYDQWRQVSQNHDVLWLNGYGPTETTVACIFYQAADDVAVGHEVPIGRPIANTNVYILDENRQPVPVGLPGELYIGGEVLARGYLHQADLTAERFVANPFLTAAPEKEAPRFYKTGDIARYLPDGNIEFLGRTDRQVKIRGYRIEPGEVEAVLLQHPNVRQTAVLARTNESNHKQLVAYVVPQTENKPPTKALRRFLQQKLPDYMIPAAFVTLDVMPLTPSGKIDRKALPEPDKVRAALAQPYEKPRTIQEQMLSEVWANVLQVDQVGIHDNFFDLGGHSLLATQVVSRLEKTTGMSIPLRSLFERPTVADLSATLDQARRTSDLTPPPILPVARDGEIPLSFAQERMWFLHQLAPHDHAYHIPVVLKYRQAINREALQKAIDVMVARHESLRTIFLAADGVPRQKILPPYSVTINEIDLTSIPVVDQETAVIQLIQADTRLPYDLTAAPPWRLTLFRLNDELHVFYFAFHHILMDQWSIVVLWQDFYALYNAYLRDETPALPALDIQYADFSVWQRNWLQGPALANMLAYWRNQLADMPVLDLPTDHPRPPVQTFTGATEFLYLSPTLTESLHTFSRQAQISPFMLLLAVFKMLLARYAGQTDIAVGVPVANRHYLAVEPIIGTFVNTLVVRTDLSGDPTFAQLIARVRDVLLDAYAHQELPFEKLVSEIVETRDLSHTPLVQVLFNMTNAPFDYEQAAESPISFMTFDRGAAQFDLSVNVVMEKHLPIEPQVIVEYNTRLFEQGTIRRLLAHFETLLSAAVADARLPISRYEMLSPAEQRLLTKEWNQTQMAYPSRCLHELFTEQVRRTPWKTAVSFKEQSLTYQELDERSNQLARYLQSLGVGPEIVVGMFVERSLGMVVGLLGVLKAGGAYLPLDPSFPADRLAFMVAETEVEVILTQADLIYTPPAANVLHSVCLDTQWPQIEQLSPEPLPQTAVSENRAYIIYTSGSTGKPKGVQLEHRNVVNFMTAMQQQPGICPNDILLAVTTLSFDISVLEIFLPLLNGAQVVIADRLTAVDGRQLIKTINQVQATTLQATPTTWSMLIEAGWKNTPTLRQALCGGEALPRELAQAILARGVELWNMYGPTETTIWSSIQQITPDQNRITIGRPIGNNTFYVLDPSGQPVPIGVAGELYIGGDGVARGYLNRPELTCERFRPDPFTCWSSTGRMYRTGDLARYLPDGAVEYLGRIDFQVKIHGHRIELGEIEAALSAHPHVREVVVAVHNNQNDQILAAYIVPHAMPHESEKHPTTMQIRDFLRASLPDYMLPAAFVYLQEFPLTPNRKINRQALPPPGSALPISQGYAAPRDHLEQLLVSIWQDVLQRKPIGIHDDFFALGGHSLNALRLFTRLEKSTGKSMPLTTLFVAPTIAELAARMSEEGWTPDWSVLVPIQPNGHKPPFFMIAPYAVSVLELNDIGGHFEERPFFGIQPLGLQEGEEIHDTLQAMAAHYIQAIRSVQPHGPYYLGGHCSGAWVAYEMAAQLEEMGETVGFLALIDSKAPTYCEPDRGSLRYLINRLRYYQRDGRLFNAVRWQIKLLAEKWFLYRYGTAQQKRILAVREIHYAAFNSYQARRDYTGPMTIIRSTDNLNRYLLDDWYANWLEMTTWEAEILDIDSTHAMLIFDPQAEQLAGHLKAGMEPSPSATHFRRPTPHRVEQYE